MDHIEASAQRFVSTESLEVAAHTMQASHVHPRPLKVGPYLLLLHQYQLPIGRCRPLCHMYSVCAVGPCFPHANSRAL